MVSELIDQQKSSHSKEASGPPKQISPKAEAAKGSPAVQAQNQLMCLLQKQKAVAAVKARENTATAVGSLSHQSRQASQPPGGPTGLIINSQQPGHQTSPRANAPLFLNLSQLQGSNGLIIVSSQTGGQISILNNQPQQQQQQQQHSNQQRQPEHRPHQDSNTSNVMTVESIPERSGSEQTGLPRSGFNSTTQSLSVHNQNQVQLNATLAVGGEDRSAANGAHNHVSLVSSAKGHQQLNQGFSLDEQNAERNAGDLGHRLANGQQGHVNGQSNAMGDIVPGLEQSDPRTNHQTGESSMDVASPGMESFPSHHPDMDTHVGGTTEKPSVNDLVSALNVKNEMQHFDQHQLSSEELMSVLSNNLAHTAVGNSPDGPSSAASSSHPQTALESIDSLSSSMASQPSNDLFVDLDTLLNQVLPDLDSDAISSDMSSTPTPSSGFEGIVNSTTTSSAAMTTSSPSTTSCNGFHVMGSSTGNNSGTAAALHSKSPNEKAKTTSTTKHDTSRAGIANITDYSPEWSYPEGIYLHDQILVNCKVMSVISQGFLLPKA